MLQFKCSWPQLLVFARHYSTANSPIVLRPYQEHCIKACIDALDRGVSRIGVSLPTGSGKTTVFITLLSRLRAAKEEATRSLVIVNSIELARQSAATAKHLFPDWSVEIEQGAKHSASGAADLTVATYQTLLNSTRFSKFDPSYFKAVIVDEAHHAAAPSYRKLLARFHRDIRPNVRNEVEYPDHDYRVPIFGFSATFSRHDALALGTVFEEIVYHRNFLEMIEEEWLCSVRLTSVKSNLNLDNVAVNGQSGDFKTRSLAEVMNTPGMNEMVVKVWMDRAGQSRKSTLVFCVDLNHVRELTQAFRSRGIDARFLHSLTPARERKELITAFRAGEFPVLVNCAVLTEGADIPNIDCVLLARPTRSQNVFMQMIGRGMRLSPSTGKEDCLLVDFVDSSTKVTSVVSLPTLLGLDAWDMDQDTTLEELKAEAKVNVGMVEHKSVEDVVLNSVTYTDHDNILDSFAKPETEGAGYLSLSQNAWVQCGDENYILECMGRGYIQIKLVEEDGSPPKYHASYVNQYKHRPSLLVITPDLRMAFVAADQYAINRVGGSGHGRNLHRYAKWRSAQPTPGQIQIIQKKFEASKKVGDDAFTALVMSSVPSRKRSHPVESLLSSLTKGEASTILCKVMHGGLRLFRDQERMKARAQKAIAKKAVMDRKLNSALMHPQNFLFEGKGERYAQSN